MILDELADYARLRVAKDCEENSIEVLQELCCNSNAHPNRPRFCFEQALRQDGLSFICEVKKASPSKGVIAKHFPYLEIAKQYEQAGADCISCLTEPKWFLGSDEIFTEIRRTVNTPMIRKDFTVDEYQIYQAKLMGADAVLLICAILDTDTIARYLSICDINIVSQPHRNRYFLTYFYHGNDAIEKHDAHAKQPHILSQHKAPLLP